MRHDDEAAAIFEDFLEGGQCTADTGVVGDVTVFVQGHIEVNAYDGFLAGKLVIVYFHF